MTFTPYDGTNSTTANSLISVADADSYFALRLNSTDWTGADSSTKEAALYMATSYMNGLYFMGYRSNTDQAICFPRTGMGLIDNNDYNSDTVIPADILNACCEAAIAQIANNTTAVSNNNIKSEKLDVLETTYFSKGSTNTFYSSVTPQFFNYINKFTDSGTNLKG